MGIIYIMFRLLAIMAVVHAALMPEQESTEDRIIVIRKRMSYTHFCRVLHAYNVRHWGSRLAAKSNAKYRLGVYKLYKLHGLTKTKMYLGFFKKTLGFWKRHPSAGKYFKHGLYANAWWHKW